LAAFCLNRWNAAVFEPSHHGSSLIPKMDEPWAYVPQTIAGKWERRSIPNNILHEKSGILYFKVSIRVAALVQSRNDLD
jgi:hypothetical protein